EWCAAEEKRRRAAYPDRVRSGRRDARGRNRRRSKGAPPEPEKAASGRPDCPRSSDTRQKVSAACLQARSSRRTTRAERPNGARLTAGSPTWPEKPAPSPEETA